MGIRSFISLGLVMLPIGVTLGLLIGLDAQRKATGQEPLFVDNSVDTTTYCQKSYGIAPPSYGQSYTLNPNQWAWQEGDPGHLCMKVQRFNNATYPTKTSAPKFSVTWHYPQGPETQPVHAFPNIALNNDDGKFPALVRNIRHLYVNVEWSYGLGKRPVKTTDVSAMTSAQVNANVAIDMFLDADSSKAQDTTKAKYEVMVWLAKIGGSTDPLGLADGAVGQFTVNTTKFELYRGQNGLGQWVYTWLAASTTENFVGDIAPLVTGIDSLGLSNAPTTKDYFGYMGLGSEAYWSPHAVTFAVPHLAMQVL